MKKINNPHPIIGGDSTNFENHKFICDGNFTINEEKNFCFDFRATLDEPLLNKYLDKDKIEFIIVIESLPYYSEVFKPNDKSDKLAIVANIKYSDVPVNFDLTIKPMLIAKDNFYYQNKNAIYPLNNIEFYILKGNILGRCANIKIKFDSVYNRLKGGSLIIISNSGESKGKKTMDIDLANPNNIIVKLNTDDYYLLLNLYNNNDKLFDALLTLPVLQYAISDLVKTDSSNREYDWAKNLDSQFEIYNLEDNPKDIWNKCIEILQNPIVKLAKDMKESI